MNIQGITSPQISTLHSVAMISRLPVGEESMDLPESTIKPVEQSADIDNTNIKQDSEQYAAKDKVAVQDRIEQEQIQQLAARDREVRNHERAHAAVGGQYAGAPRYEFQRGPDGVSYAIGGEVSISTSPVNGNPQMTIEKAQIIKRAALAPAEPSAQDRKVAAEAMQMEMEARVELADIVRQERLQEQELKESQMMDKKSESAHIDGAKNDLPSRDKQPAVDSVDTMNHAQEEFFNDINNDLAAQLVALGGAQQSPQSLGSIVSRFV